MPAIKPEWKHQGITRRHLKAHPDSNDFSDPGTGKTRGHLDAFYEAGEGRLLILCPRSIMQSAWGDDIDTFTPNLTYAIAKAGAREAAFRQGTDVVVANLDGVKDIAKCPKWLDGFTDIVIDESTGYKNLQSQRTKAALVIRRYFKRHRQMTGTPNPKSVTELFAPMMITDGGKRLGKSFFKFRSAVADPVQNGPLPEHRIWVDKPGAQQGVMDLIADITIRHEFEKVMSHVPPNHRNTKHFQLNKKCQAIYERLEDDSIVLINEEAVVGVNAAVLRNKLLQVCSGAVYSAGDKYELVDTTRYELIADLIEDIDHSVVFFNWKHQRDELVKELTTRRIKFAVMDGATGDTARSQIVRDYQAGKLQTLLMHPQTGAHGLTLTRGRTTIICSPIYQADFLKQTIHRIYRGSQDKVTNTILVCAKGTVEEIVYEKLFDRTAKMQDLLALAALRRR